MSLTGGQESLRLWGIFYWKVSPQGGCPVSNTPDQIRQQAASVFPYAVSARRHLHAHPELSFEEKETAAFIEAELRSMGYEPQTGVGGYGIKAVLQGAKPGPTIALRADIDALPIVEE